MLFLTYLSVHTCKYSYPILHLDSQPFDIVMLTFLSKGTGLKVVGVPLYGMAPLVTLLNKLILHNSLYIIPLREIDNLHSRVNNRYLPHIIDAKCHL